MEGNQTDSGRGKTTEESKLLTAGNLIAYWCKRRQGKPNTPLSISELAALCRISPAALRRYERGQTVPQTQTLFAIAAALDIPPHILLAPMWRKMREEMSHRRNDLNFGPPLAKIK